MTWKILRNWLQRYGFSYKKPALVPGKSNGQQQREWMAEYEKLKQDLPVDETIRCMDGVHPTHNVQPAYGWIQKGVRKEIPANNGRSRINLSGVLNVMDHKVLIQEDKMLNAGVKVYFANPNSPWQRVTNENTNGLIRQYFPKGSDFTKVTLEQIKFAQDLLNTRPRKVLDWSTPLKEFENLTGALKS